MHKINSLRRDLISVTASAPASSANCIAGFDCLGFSFSPLKDSVEISFHNDEPELNVTGLTKGIPCILEENIVGHIVKEFSSQYHCNLNIRIHLDKGIPVSSGLGGSAASIVAFLKALNSTLVEPLCDEALLEFAVWAESLISGDRHADNVVPCFFGGFYLMHPDNAFLSYKLPIPRDLIAVISLPDLQVETKKARSIIPKQIELQKSIYQSKQIASFIHFLYGAKTDFHFHDAIAEDYRKQYIPDYDLLKERILKLSALGVSLSGSGPALLALCNNKIHAESIKNAFHLHFKHLGISSREFLYHPNNQGVYINKINGVKIA